MDDATADKLAGENPDYGIEKLFNAIESGDYPSWTVYIQTMTPEQAEKFRYNILDLTKIWSHHEYPLRPIGKLVLNDNPQNYFAEIEQSAFSPSHLIPYIEPSADPILQSRLFSYPDTHRHRLGTNYQQLPVNAPIVPVVNFQRDGPGAYISQGSLPNYQSSLKPLKYGTKKGAIDSGSRDEERQARHEAFVGGAWRDLSFVTELDFEQPRDLWIKVFGEKEREAYVKNVSGHFKNVKSPEIKARQLSVWAAVDQGLSDRIADAVGHPHVKPLQVKAASEADKYRLKV